MATLWSSHFFLLILDMTNSEFHRAYPIRSEADILRYTRIIQLSRRKMYHSKVWDQFQQFRIDNPDLRGDLYGTLVRERALKSLRCLRLIHRMSERIK